LRTVDGGFVATIQKIKRAKDTSYRFLMMHSLGLKSDIKKLQSIEN